MHKGIRDYLLAFILILFFINACSSPASSVPSSIPQSTISPTKLQPTQTTPLSEPADVIFHNGNIITIEKNPHARICGRAHPLHPQWLG
jgi:PBP1b-binding outer membrane lipoprotein LpoB